MGRDPSPKTLRCSRSGAIPQPCLAPRLQILSLSGPSARTVVPAGRVRRDRARLHDGCRGRGARCIIICWTGPFEGPRMPPRAQLSGLATLPAHSRERAPAQGVQRMLRHWLDNERVEIGTTVVITIYIIIVMSDRAMFDVFEYIDTTSRVGDPFLTVSVRRAWHRCATLCGRGLLPSRGDVPVSWQAATAMAGRLVHAHMLEPVRNHWACRPPSSQGLLAGGRGVPHALRGRDRRTGVRVLWERLPPPPPQSVQRHRRRTGLRLLRTALVRGPVAMDGSRQA